MGRGFGAHIWLNSELWFSNTPELVSISTYHNGYIYVLHKTGIFGLLFFTRIKLCVCGTWVASFFFAAISMKRESSFPGSGSTTPFS
jgi:O-antigen ligase